MNLDELAPRHPLSVGMVNDRAKLDRANRSLASFMPSFPVNYRASRAIRPTIAPCIPRSASTYSLSSSFIDPFLRL